MRGEINGSAPCDQNLAYGSALRPRPLAGYQGRTRPDQHFSISYVSFHPSAQMMLRIIFARILWLLAASLGNEKLKLSGIYADNTMLRRFARSLARR